MEVVLLILAVPIILFILGGGLSSVAAKLTGKHIVEYPKWGGTPRVHSPDDLDNMANFVKESGIKTKETLTKGKDVLNKRILGTYKYLFRKIDALKLYEKDKLLTFYHFFSVKTEIDEYKKRPAYISHSYIPEELIKKHNDFIPYIDKTNFEEFLKLLKQTVGIKSQIEMFELLEKLGLRNCNSLFLIIKEIDSEFWGNEISEQEMYKLYSYLFRKIGITE